MSADAMAAETVALETTGLGKRFGHHWALSDCSFALPAWRIAALVGPNGAGKTTLLQLAVGLLRPTTCEARVFGHAPLSEPLATLPRVGFVAQDHPLYRGFSVADLLTMGRKLNPRWDQPAAGTLLRRTVAAMFATLAGYAGVTLGIVLYARQHLLPPLTATWNPYTSSGPTPASNQDWILYSGYLDAAGKQIDSVTVYSACAPSGNMGMRPDSAFNACVHAHGWLSTLVWQPASRFWAFQGVESAIFVALALGLLALALWWMRSRLS